MEEQIDYVQSLWDRIATSPDRVAVPDWHQRLIAERVAEHEANPDDLGLVGRSSGRDRSQTLRQALKKLTLRRAAQRDIDAAVA